MEKNTIDADRLGPPLLSKLAVGRPPLIPVIHIEKASHSEPLLAALERGGIGMVEVTLRSSVALEVIERMRRASRGALIGAGTLTRPAHFEQATQAGAQFLVSPALTPELAKAAKTAALPFIPGVCTPTEALLAREHGFLEQKFFPADLNGGINWIRHVYPLFPDVRFCPTGGISNANSKDFLGERNIFAVGGVYLAPRAMIESENWDEIARIVADGIKSVM